MNNQQVTPETDKALTEKEVAKRWGITTRTLYNWRVNKSGPKFFLVGTHVKYMLSEVVRYEQNNTHDGGPSRPNEFPEGSATGGFKVQTTTDGAQ